MRVLLRAADVLADEVQAARTNGRADEHETASMVAELEAWIAGEPLGAEAAAPAEAEPAFEPIAMAPPPPPPVEDDFGFKPMTFAIPDLEPIAPVAAKTAGPSPSSRTPPLYAKANETGALAARTWPAGAGRDRSRRHRPAAAGGARSGNRLSGLDRPHRRRHRRTAIREVFEFVDGDCDLTITGPIRRRRRGPGGPARRGRRPAAGRRRPDPARRRRAGRAAPGAGRPPPVAAAPVEPAPVAPPPAPTAAIAAIVEETARVVENARADTGGGRPTGRPGGEPAAAQATIRVDPERIDRLIDLVGELVINQAMLAQRVASTASRRPRTSPWAWTSWSSSPAASRTASWPSAPSR